MKKFFSLVFLLTVLTGGLALRSGGQVTPDKSTFTKNEMDLRASLRKVFNDHVTWARIASVEILTNAKDVTRAQDRLMKNQEDIGAVFSPFYGADTAKQITDQFKRHAQLLIDYTSALKKGGETKPIIDNLTAVADATADLLSSKNPNWKKDDLSSMFRDHEKDLKAEIDQQKNSPGSLDVAQLDRTSDHGMAIADTLAYGIMKQHADKLK